MGVRLHQALLSSDPEEAVSFLGEVLVMAKPEGNIRILVDFWPPIVPLLRRAIAAGVEPDFATRILNIIESEERQRKIRKGKTFTTSSILSKREMEVLQLLVNGLTNQQIAERLVISLDTTKTHVHHILDKLDATSRVQAIARARDLDLL
jgi:LuxR family maltose regulon positive regulatory protein